MSNPVFCACVWRERGGEGKEIINLSSADFAQRVVKVILASDIRMHYYFFLFFFFQG